MLILFEFNLHVSNFFILVHGLVIELVGGFLVLLEFGLLDRNGAFHGLETDTLLVELGLVFALFGTELLV